MLLKIGKRVFLISEKKLATDVHTIPISQLWKIAALSSIRFPKPETEFYSVLSKRVNYPFEFATLRVRPHAVVRLG